MTEEHGCCSHTDEPRTVANPSHSRAYFCLMCPGVEQDKPGVCPKCGMALEKAIATSRSPAQWTCPMHPEVVQGTFTMPSLR
jgi:Cu+-exporting ATPase